MFTRSGFLFKFIAFLGNRQLTSQILLGWWGGGGQVKLTAPAPPSQTLLAK